MDDYNSGHYRGGYDKGVIGSITTFSASQPEFSPVLAIHPDKGALVMENDEIHPPGFHPGGPRKP